MKAGVPFMHLPQPSFHLSLLLSYTSIQLWGILWQGLDHLTEKNAWSTLAAYGYVVSFNLYCNTNLDTILPYRGGNMLVLISAFFLSKPLSELKKIIISLREKR